MASVVHLELPEVPGRAEDVREEGVDVEGSRRKSGQGKLLLLLLLLIFKGLVRDFVNAGNYCCCWC